MNIVISILSIIDTILIYLIDIRMGNLITEILIDVLGGGFIALIWLKIDDYYEKTVQNLKWTALVYLLFTFVYILIAIVKKDFNFYQSVCSPVIPVYISYYVILIKRRREEK